MRLIDADDLESVTVWVDDSGFIEVYRGSEIDNAPTVDAVEVVRCKECRWYKKWKTVGRDDGYCVYERMTRDGLQYINTNADDFCSYGERRTDE